MSVGERFEVAAILRDRYYGTGNPDMREAVRQGYVKKTHRSVKRATGRHKDLDDVQHLEDVD